MSNNIKLCDAYSCTQCRACEAVCPKKCISFVEGKDGFLLPIIEDSFCIKCGLCVKSCHQLNPILKKRPLLCYAAWSKEDQIRRSSSSGGAFSEIARYICNRGGVVVGAVMDRDLKVHHSFAESMDQIAPMRGSKYVQSDLNGVFAQIKHILNEGRLVLFTGTPCQVAGLYSFLKKDYENLLTCDLVCHGVPSQKSFDNYCSKINLNLADTAEFRFRYTEGWGFQMGVHPYSESAHVRWRNISPRKSYYLRAFTRGLMFNEACYSCHYATIERVGDITMADYWGIGANKPFTHSTKNGVSLLLVNSEKARCVLNECKMLYIEERPLNEAVQGNYNLCHSSIRPKKRDTYISDASFMSINELSGKYGIHPTWRDYLRPLKRLLTLK